MKKIISLLLCMAMLFMFASCKDTKDPAQGTEEPKYLYEVDSGKVKIVSLNAADGVFVEKGNKDEVKQTATITVLNDSDRMLEYAEIVFTVNEYERAEFIVSALPAGQECVVMETTARVMKSDDKYTLDSRSCTFAYCDQNLTPAEAEIKTDGSTISVTNKTDVQKDILVTYKYFKDDKYYGGIAFRGKFEQVKPGETVQKTSSRFGDDCKIVNITIYD